MAENSTSELLIDFSPMLKVYKDGSVERLTGLQFTPPSLDQETNVQSKDIVISPETNLSARLYLPKNRPNSSKKLPLLIYFHGGGFIIESAFSPMYHNHLNQLVSHAQVVILSLNYRLAPEHPLPAAYEDAWEALKWVASESHNEDWIKEFADLDRVYLGGDSAGGNMAHNMAVKFGLEKLDGINVVGAFLNCPYFSGKDSIGNEENHPTYPKRYLDKLWHYVCPETSGCDDPLLNPATDANISSLGCKKVLVYVAEKDVLRERGWYYKEILEKSDWNGEIEVVEVEGEDHVFSVFVPTSDKATAMFEKLASFVSDQ